MPDPAPVIVPVELGSRRYDVLVEAGALDAADRHLAPYARGGRMVTVADERVWALHGDRFSAALARAGIHIDPVLLPPGESTKSWAMLANVCDRLLALEVERSDHIVAFGGGVIGDLVGFAAAILKRGCEFVQVPTTLLAQVDSSVGGKTAINTPAGKNMVGAFHQPSFVLADPALLATLPRRDLVAGYAEVVKYGLIDDPAFFTWCETNGAALLDGDLLLQTEAVAHSVAAKARVVVADERETADLRALLNLGHTFGHALEAECGFSDRLLHGEAVAAGMALAFRFSTARGLCPASDADRMISHLAAAGLPTGLAGIAASGDKLIRHMALDKKKSAGTLPFILAKGIGRAYVDRTVALSDVAAFLDAQPR